MIGTSLKGKYDERNWFELLPRVEFRVNTTHQNITKFSHFESVLHEKNHTFRIWSQ